MLLREVIFVDLALAQIVAMGAVIAFYFGYEHGTPAVVRHLSGRSSTGSGDLQLVPYARSARTAGSHHRHQLCCGHRRRRSSSRIGRRRVPSTSKSSWPGTIIWVTWSTVFKVLRVCAAVGVLYYLLRRRLHLISENPERAYEQGVKVRWWDFLFYVLFGLVITVSVEIAGVLMVFAYLVAPAIIALASSSSWSARIGVTWLVGLMASALGLLASYHWDLPSGPAIVCFLGLDSSLLRDLAVAVAPYATSSLSPSIRRFELF